MKLTLHPGAESDVEEAAEFYEREGSAALAARFLEEFKRLARLLLDHPEIGAPRPKGRRSFSMRVFPYSVIYRLRANEVRILVVKHDRKRPGHGGTRT